MSAEQLAAELIPADKKILNRAELAEVSGYTVQALADMASKGRGPAFLKPGNGRNVIYTRGAAIAWLSRKAVIPA